MARDPHLATALAMLACLALLILAVVKMKLS